MFNIHDRKWDSDLLRVLEIPDELLPGVAPSAGVVGQVDPSVLGVAIPIAGIAGDQQAALFGQGRFSEGQAKNTYGTGCFLLLNVADNKYEPKNGLILTLACEEDGKPCYSLEGSIFIGGAVVQWLRGGLGLIKRAEETGKDAQKAVDNSAKASREALIKTERVCREAEEAAEASIQA